MQLLHLIALSSLLLNFGTAYDYNEKDAVEALYYASAA